MNKSSIIKHGFDLEERTLKFAKSVLKLCKQLSQNVINKELISQLVRSSGSVGANYREANDALSKKDFIHRIKITRKEAKETHYWLELLLEVNTKYKEAIDPLIKESLEIKKIFSSIVEKSS
ncbi:MAG: four helix bundle protein [Candidatus Aenigmarchaeota archaeon]|nr:four helix bundle protein [Candidatus Aenigmarchaeota archaeon]